MKTSGFGVGLRNSEIKIVTHDLVKLAIVRAVIRRMFTKNVLSNIGRRQLSIFGSFYYKSSRYFT